MTKDQRTGDRHAKDGPRQRSVRGISDELWQAAKDKAVREGSSLSDVVEALLARWTKEP